jgi:type IV pilus assembly protein PilA
MKKGFTLIELIIVIVIIGVLATFAVPLYLKSTERAKEVKAKHALGIIARAEKMYRSNNDQYLDFAIGGADAALGAYIELADIDTDNDWTYETSGSSSSGFLTTATRSNGNNAGETISFDQSGIWGGDFTP